MNRGSDDSNEVSIDKESTDHIENSTNNDQKSTSNQSANHSTVNESSIELVKNSDINDSGIDNSGIETSGIENSVIDSSVSEKLNPQTPHAKPPKEVITPEMMEKYRSKRKRVKLSELKDPNPLVVKDVRQAEPIKKPTYVIAHEGKIQEKLQRSDKQESEKQNSEKLQKSEKQMRSRVVVTNKFKKLVPVESEEDEKEEKEKVEKRDEVEVEDEVEEKEQKELKTDANSKNDEGDNNEGTVDKTSDEVSSDIVPELKPMNMPASRFGKVLPHLEARSKKNRKRKLASFRKENRENLKKQKGN